MKKNDLSQALLGVISTNPMTSPLEPKHSPARETSATSTEQVAKLIALVDQAAPIMMKLAYSGGSMFAKDWLDRAKEFGIDALE